MKKTRNPASATARTAGSRSGDGSGTPLNLQLCLVFVTILCVASIGPVAFKAPQLVLLPLCMACVGVLIILINGNHDSMLSPAMASSAPKSPRPGMSSRKPPMTTEKAAPPQPNKQVPPSLPRITELGPEHNINDRPWLRFK